MTGSTDFNAAFERGRQAYAAGEPAVAIAALEQAAAVAGEASQLRSLAGLHRRFGRLELAVAALRRVLAFEPGAADAHLHIALMLDHADEDGDLRAALAAYEHANASDRIPLGFALGKIYEDIGQVDRAFAFYAGANAARRKGLTVSIDQIATEFAAIEETFTPELFRRLADFGLPEERPIFIVGMPRSGSTLTEHILASHPEILGGGEMNLMPRVEATMTQQAGSLATFLAEVEPGTLSQWAHAYLDPVKQALGTRTRFTDKNLDNFRRVGLLKLLFPNATIVHCTRDPLDTGFSIYRRLFGHGIVEWGYDLREIGAYHRLYRSLMDHWHRVLPGSVLDHSYEELVAHPEPAIRRLLDACGLVWDPRVLDFHRTERGVITASATQVRRPVYADSVGTSAAYRAHLAPLADALRTAP